MSALKHIK